MPEDRSLSPGEGTLPTEGRWPPEEARKAAVKLAQEVGRAVTHCCLAFMEQQAGAGPRE